jgi:hypothetical protein
MRILIILFPSLYSLIDEYFLLFEYSLISEFITCVDDATIGNREVYASSQLYRFKFDRQDPDVKTYSCTFALILCKEFTITNFVEAPRLLFKKDLPPLLRLHFLYGAIRLKYYSSFNVRFCVFRIRDLLRKLIQPIQLITFFSKFVHIQRDR